MYVGPCTVATSPFPFCFGFAHSSLATAAGAAAPGVHARARLVLVSQRMPDVYGSGCCYSRWSTHRLRGDVRLGREGTVYSNASSILESTIPLPPLHPRGCCIIPFPRGKPTTWETSSDEVHTKVQPFCTERSSSYDWLLNLAFSRGSPSTTTHAFFLSHGHLREPPNSEPMSAIKCECFSECPSNRALHTDVVRTLRRTTNCSR